MAIRVEKINPDIVRQCREQIGLGLSAASEKIKSIAKIEAGEINPTVKQLDLLSDLCKVPQWVFFLEELPEEYQFNQTPVFRKFAKRRPKIFDEHETRTILVQVERLRELMLDLQEDQDDPIGNFQPPETYSFYQKNPPDKAARFTREWLAVENERFDFSGWRKKVEDKGVFVFVTSKHRGRSYVKGAFRGLAVYRDLLPMIIINDRDSKKAQSFTLFHELGHILRRETEIDGEEMFSQQEEEWCNKFAGCMLMPEGQFRAVAAAQSISDSSKINLDDAEKLAKQFEASTYACVIRMRQLNMIRKSGCDRLLLELKKEYENSKHLKFGKPRNRPREVMHQYGESFLRTVAQAHYDDEIGLHKFCRIFDLRDSSYALAILENLNQQ